VETDRIQNQEGKINQKKELGKPSWSHKQKYDAFFLIKFEYYNLNFLVIKALDPDPDSSKNQDLDPNQDQRIWIIMT
jgi:hypothetical protein